MVKCVAGYPHFSKLWGAMSIAGMQCEGKRGAMRVQRRMLWFDLVGLDQQVSEGTDGIFEIIKVLATADVKFF
jgi:hypothetical protein